MIGVLRLFEKTNRRSISNNEAIKSGEIVLNRSSVFGFPEDSGRGGKSLVCSVFRIQTWLRQDLNRGYAISSRFFKIESLILAQDERWRRASGMQVERESCFRVTSTVAHG